MLANFSVFFQGRCGMAVDQDKPHAFLGKAIGDIDTAVSANIVLSGEKN